jgi:hypothetical protein
MLYVQLVLLASAPSQHARWHRVSNAKPIPIRSWHGALDPGCIVMSAGRDTRERFRGRAQGAKTVRVSCRARAQVRTPPKLLI